MKKTVSIIGGGTAALLVAAFLDPSKFKVTIYERNKTLGRKFLVAGDGGFNLTHSEKIETFIEQYTPSSFLEKALLNFDNNAFRNWLKSINGSQLIAVTKSGTDWVMDSKSHEMKSAQEIFDRSLDYTF